MAAVERARSAPGDDGEPGPAAAVVVTFPVRVSRASIPGMCDQVRVLLRRTGAGAVVADAAPLAEPDLAAVEAIVRLKLIAVRLDRAMRLAGASPDLLELLTFAGLDEVVS